jgi:hypothetical protein
LAEIASTEIAMPTDTAQIADDFMASFPSNLSDVSHWTAGSSVQGSRLRPPFRLHK